LWMAHSGAAATFILVSNLLPHGRIPEVVQEWINTGNPGECLNIQHDLPATYRDDFNKYGGEIEATVLSKMMWRNTEWLHMVISIHYARCDTLTRKFFGANFA